MEEGGKGEIYRKVGPCGGGLAEFFLLLPSNTLVFSDFLCQGPKVIT